MNPWSFVHILVHGAAVNEKGCEFEKRARRIISEGLEGEREGRNDVIIL